MAPWDDAPVGNAHVSIDNEVHIELTLHTKPLACATRAERGVERKHTRRKFGHESPVFGASEVFRPSDGLALFSQVGVGVFTQFLRMFWFFQTFHGQGASAQP